MGYPFCFLFSIYIFNFIYNLIDALYTTPSPKKSKSLKICNLKQFFSDTSMVLLENYVSAVFE